MNKIKTYVDFARPFTLLPPALGVVSGAVTAWGAHGTREAITSATLLPVLWGALMAAVLNSASNAINQIYDLEIDRVNKAKRPLPSGALTMGEAWGVHPGELRRRLDPRLARRSPGPRGAPRVLLDRSLHQRPRLGLLGAALPHEGPRHPGERHDRHPPAGCS